MIWQFCINFVHYNMIREESSNSHLRSNFIGLDELFNGELRLNCFKNTIRELRSQYIFQALYFHKSILFNISTFAFVYSFYYVFANSELVYNSLKRFDFNVYIDKARMTLKMLFYKFMSYSDAKKAS